MRALPLQDAVRQFLEYCEIERGRSPATIRMYAFVLDRFLAFCVRERAQTTHDITAELVRKFRLQLHRRPGRKGETLTPGSQNLYLVVLRSFLKFCVKRDIASLAPEKIELAKQPEREVEFLEPEEVERLLAAPMTVRSKRLEVKSKKNMRSELLTSYFLLITLRDAAILEVLFSTGMRVSELAGLQREEVNLKRQEFAVRGKGGKVRVVFLSDTARAALEKYLAARRDPSPYVFVRHDRASPASSRAAESTSDDNCLSSRGTRRVRGCQVFETTEPTPRAEGSRSTRNEISRLAKLARNDDQKDRPLTPRSIERLVARYARAAGIVKDVHPHTLRHSFATDLLRGGAQLRDVQAMLGHASITTTQIYTHVTEAHLRSTHAKHHRRRGTAR